MKTFVPGQIASAKDVNDNFDELYQLASIKTWQPILENRWNADPSSGPIYQVGKRFHLPICVKWPYNDFRVTAGEGFPIYHIPEGVPTPRAWTALGFIHNGAYVMPLVYRTEGRAISVQPTASFTWNKNWCYGTATWIGE